MVNSALPTARANSCVVYHSRTCCRSIRATSIASIFSSLSSTLMSHLMKRRGRSPTWLCNFLGSGDGIQNGHRHLRDLLSLFRHFTSGESDPQVGVLGCQRIHARTHGAHHQRFLFPLCFFGYLVAFEDDPNDEGSTKNNPDDCTDQKRCHGFLRKKRG